jgi:hypothetical protein
VEKMDMKEKEGIVEELESESDEIKEKLDEM